MIISKLITQHTEYNILTNKYDKIIEDSASAIIIWISKYT